MLLILIASCPPDQARYIHARSEKERVQVEGKTPAVSDIKAHRRRRMDIPPGGESVVFGEVRFSDRLIDHLERRHHGCPTWRGVFGAAKRPSAAVPLPRRLR